jgi:predicted nucleic acid-binding protein
VGLIERVGSGPVALDTACFIYFIKEHPRYLPKVEPIFAAVAAGRMHAVTSALTLLEVLVVPYRAGDHGLAGRYEQLLTRSRGLRVVDLDRTQLRVAAQLRAVHTRLRTPDALQMAAALSARCGALITNDRELPAVAGLRVLQLSGA